MADGDGKDSILAEGYRVAVYGESGDDELFDFGNASESLFDGGKGNDRIDLGGNVGNTINGGAGNDDLNSTGTNLVLNGGAGNDTLSSHGVDYGHNNLLIDTLENNYFSVNTDYTTVIAGSGNDSIEM